MSESKKLLFLGECGTVELWAGTGSFSKVAKERGYGTYTVDNDPQFEPSLILDLSKPITPELRERIGRALLVWMSPMCRGLTLAAGNTHWKADRTPRTEVGRLAHEMLMRAWKIAEFCDANGIIYFIENPKAGRATWFLPSDERRHEVWYCRYGERRAKPTYIWTNLKGWKAKKCHRGNPDHEPAPRGSRGSTQGMSTIDAGRLPPALFHEIFDVFEAQ